MSGFSCIKLFQILSVSLSLILAVETQAYCSPLTERLSDLVEAHPFPHSSSLSREEWINWVDRVSLELSSEIHESSPRVSELSLYSVSRSTSDLTQERHFPASQVGEALSERTYSDTAHTLYVELTQLRDLDHPLWRASSQSEVLSWIEARFSGALSILKRSLVSHSHDSFSPPLSLSSSSSRWIGNEGIGVKIEQVLASVESFPKALSRLQHEGIKLRLILGRTLEGLSDRCSNQLLPFRSEDLWVVGDLLNEKDQVEGGILAVHLDFNSPVSLRRMESGLFEEIYLDWSTSKWIQDTRVFLLQMNRLLAPGGSLYLPVGEGVMSAFDSSRKTPDLLVMETPQAPLSFFPNGASFPKGIALNAALIKGVSPDELQGLITEKKKEWLRRVAEGAMSLGYSIAMIHQSEIYPIRSHHFLSESDGEYKSNFLHLRKERE